MEILDIKQQDYSFFGERGHINGTLKLTGPTMIASFIEGEITMSDKADLQIEQEGKIKGSVICNNITVYGTIEGNIDASGKVIIHSTANITGKINANSMQIYPGATMNIEGHSGQ